jgi:hypothetical protein
MLLAYRLQIGIDQDSALLPEPLAQDSHTKIYTSPHKWAIPKHFLFGMYA